MSFNLRYLSFFFMTSCGLFFSGSLAAQATLREKLQGVDQFEDIIKVLEDYYSAPHKEKIEEENGEPEEIHAWRWAFEMSSRLGPQGDIVDVSARLMRATKLRDKIFQSGSRASVGNWTFVGPSTTTYTGTSFSALLGMGRVDRLAFHPTDPGTVYAATPSGGLWKTTDYGDNWSCLTSNLPSIGIGGIVVSQSNPNVIYILTGDGDTWAFGAGLGYLRKSAGVYKTIDGGITWAKTGVLSDSSEGLAGFELVQSPTDANVLLAATVNGLFRTANGGASWTLVRTGLHHDVAFKPGNGNRVYATQPVSQGSFCYSIDGGITWDSCSLNISNPRISIATTAADPSIVYLLSGPSTGSGSFRGIYKSINSGASFVNVLNTPNILSAAIDGSGNDDGSLYTLGFDASPSSAGTFVTGSFICWRSIDGGASIQNITPYWESQNMNAYVHPDIHDIQYNPLNGDLYAAGDGGVFRSTDGGNTWNFISNGINTTQFYHMTGVDNQVDRLLGGCQDNGIKLRTNNTGDFKHVDCCDGFDSDFDPTNSTSFITSINATVQKYTGDGQVVSPLSPSGMDGGFFKTVMYHSTSSDTFFIGAKDVYRTYNGGSNFTNRGASGYWAMANCPSNLIRIYVAGGDNAFTQIGEVWRSDDLGGNWTTISDGVGFPVDDIKVTDIGVNPANSLSVWVTFAGFNPEKVFFSSDGGANWINKSGTLPDVPMNCIAIDASNNAYVGTDIGVYFLASGGTDWTPFYNGLPNVPVTDLILNSSSGIIRAATYGRGVWVSDVQSTCPTNLDLLVNSLQGDNFFEASGHIHASVDITGGQNTHIRFRANDNIIFLPGFEAKAENYVHALTGGCGTGVPD